MRASRQAIPISDAIVGSLLVLAGQSGGESAGVRKILNVAEAAAGRPYAWSSVCAELAGMRRTEV